MRSLIFLSLLMVAAALPPMPVVQPKKPKHVAALLAPKQQSTTIVKLAISSTNTVTIPIQRFTNNVKFGYATNVVAMDLVWYTDDNGITWHHLNPFPWVNSNIVVIDTNAPYYRLYLDTYTAGIKVP